MSEEYSGIEKRSVKRLKINFTVLYQINKPLSIRMMIGWNKEVHATMLDLSQDGVAVLTDYDIPKSTVLQIRFTLINLGGISDSIKTMNMMGEVRYNTAMEANQHRLGILFTNIEEVDKKTIAEFVESALRKQGK